MTSPAALTSPVYFYLLLRHTADAIMYWTHDVTRSADVAWHRVQSIFICCVSLRHIYLLSHVSFADIVSLR